MRENIQKCLKLFWEENSLEISFPDAYIFGSLINREGRHFIPGGSAGSDIDLLLVFNPDFVTASQRFEVLDNFRGVATRLEYQVAKILDRKDRIFSFLPVVDYEVYHGIHKGFDPKIFKLNLFHDILTGKDEEEGLTDFIDFDFHLESMEQFSVMRTCQSYRNKYLSKDLLGNDHPDLQPFDGPGEVPKQLMRSFALLNFLDEQNATDGLRTDLEHGFEKLKSALARNSSGCSRQSEIADKVSARSFMRAKSEPLTVDDQMYLYEFAWDEARHRIRKSAREVIDGYPANGQ